MLFQGSIGRTDFPYGDHPALIRAIKEKLLPLGDDVSFLCGHGAASTIGAERQTNPFLRSFPARSPSAPLTFATGPPTACYALIAVGVAGGLGRVVQGALRLVVGADVVLGDVALLVLVDRGEMPGDGLVGVFRLVLGQVTIMRDVGLLEPLLHRCNADALASSWWWRRATDWACAGSASNDKASSTNRLRMTRPS